MKTITVRDAAFFFSMSEEGRETYTNDPSDAGGPTKWGVALNFNRHVIPDKDGNGFIDARDVQLLTEDDARRIYTTVYWIPNKCDLLPEPLAFIFADMVFNPGPGAAPKLLQQSLNTLGARLSVDGKIGPATLSALASTDLSRLLPELATQRQRYYTTRPQWQRYGLGWTRRTMRCLAAATRILTEAE